MYISINMDTLRFLHKHENIHVLTDLDFIEAPGDTVNVCPIDCQTFLMDATETEMQNLYRNSTGATDHSPLHGSQLKELLRSIADALPIADANSWETDLQAAYLMKQDPKGVKGYKYVKNATVPVRTDDLWTAGYGAQAPADLAALETAARSRAPRAAAPPAVAAGTSAAPRTPRAPSAPRSGGVRETIWKVADEMWEADGKPNDRPGILSLRKKVMDVLEQKHQIKRTSSSNELGNWQKARV